MDLFERLRRWPFRSQTSERLPILPPREAYALWSATYGVEPNLFQRIERDAIGDVLPPFGGRSVLDLGSGRGRVAQLAAAAGARHVTAADLSPHMIAAGKAGVHLVPAVVADAAVLPFRADAFDVVVSALMMGHVRALGTALGEIARVLRPGGDLVISDFHPCATLRGWERSFHSPHDGRSYAIEHHAHLFAHYCEHFQRLGLRLEVLREPLHQGFPVAFALRARKDES